MEKTIEQKVNDLYGTQCYPESIEDFNQDTRVFLEFNWIDEDEITDIKNYFQNIKHLF